MTLMTAKLMTAKPNDLNDVKANHLKKKTFFFKIEIVVFIKLNV